MSTPSPRPTVRYLVAGAAGLAAAAILFFVVGWWVFPPGGGAAVEAKTPPRPDPLLASRSEEFAGDKFRAIVHKRHAISNQRRQSRQRCAHVSRAGDHQTRFGFDTLE